MRKTNLALLISFIFIGLDLIYPGSAVAKNGASQGETLQQLLNRAPWPKYGKMDILRCKDQISGVVNDDMIFLSTETNGLQTLEQRTNKRVVRFEHKFSDDCRFLAVAKANRVSTLFDLQEHKSWSLADEQSTASVRNFQFVGKKLLYLVENGFYTSWDIKDASNEIISLDISTMEKKILFRYDSLSSFKSLKDESLIFTTGRSIQTPQNVMKEVKFYRIDKDFKEIPALLYSQSLPFNLDPKIHSSEVATISYRYSADFKALDGIEVISLTEKEVKLVISNSGRVLDMENGKFAFSKATGSGENSIFEYSPSTNDFRELKFELSLGNQELLDVSENSFIVGFTNSVIQFAILEFNSGAGSKTLYRKSEIKVPYTIALLQTKNDGTTFNNYLYRSEGPIKSVVLYVHGGGCHSDETFSPAESYPDEFAEVLNSGHAILAVNYRNSKFITPPYLKTLNATECGKDDVADILVAQKEISKLFPKKPIILWGHSQGSYLVNLATTLYANVFNVSGVVSVAGPTEFDLKTAPFNAIAKYYDARKMPIDYLQNLKVPLLMYQGKNDWNVSATHATHYSKKAIALGKNIETVFNDKGHTPKISDGADYEMWIQKLIGFLDRVSRPSYK